MSPQKLEIAIIGLGRFGATLARRLESLGQTVLGADIDPERSKGIADDISQSVICDATNIDALEEIDIKSFKTVVVAIESDFESNALITSSLKKMGIPQVICQAASSRHREILLRIGADRVIIPAEESGNQLADELTAPGLLHRLPLTADYSLIETQVTSHLENQCVEIGERYGVQVMLILRGEELILYPDRDISFQKGDLLVVLGEKRSLAEFQSLV
jgi:trk system potassium uptake protein TrkA